MAYKKFRFACSNFLLNAVKSGQKERTISLGPNLKDRQSKLQTHIYRQIDHIYIYIPTSIQGKKNRRKTRNNPDPDPKQSQDHTHTHGNKQNNRLGTQGGRIISSHLVSIVVDDVQAPPFGHNGTGRLRETTSSLRSAALPHGAMFYQDSVPELWKTCAGMTDRNVRLLSTKTLQVSICLWDSWCRRVVDIPSILMLSTTTEHQKTTKETTGSNTGEAQGDDRIFERRGRKGCYLASNTPEGTSLTKALTRLSESLLYSIFAVCASTCFAPLRIRRHLLSTASVDQARRVNGNKRPLTSSYTSSLIEMRSDTPPSRQP
ncbi:hypothetical protein V1505DRAFT_231995 [Lipomyces doorenjongii]